MNENILLLKAIEQTLTAANLPQNAKILNLIIADLENIRLDAPVKPACEYVTKIERAGRDTDYGWFRYQIQKIEEHIRVYGNKIEIRPIDGDTIRMACAFMEYRDGKRDPAGYQIVSKSV